MANTTVYNKKKKNDSLDFTTNVEVKDKLRLKSNKELHRLNIVKEGEEKISKKLKQSTDKLDDKKNKTNTITERDDEIMHISTEAHLSQRELREEEILNSSEKEILNKSTETSISNFDESFRALTIQENAIIDTNLSPNNSVLKINTSAFTNSSDMSLETVFKFDEKGEEDFSREFWKNFSFKENFESNNSFIEMKVGNSISKNIKKEKVVEVEIEKNKIVEECNSFIGFDEEKQLESNTLQECKMVK
ncbi:hypothetical protein HDU92_005231, partial [Lobulomyces angularis]